MSKLAKAPALDAFDARFARAQTEWALWVDITKHRRRNPANGFRTRVKHLLEFDRAEPAPRRGGAPHSGMAFSDRPSEGRGDHSFFSAYDALFLRLGLGLIDFGLKRKEVVLLLREQREPLRKPIGKVINASAAAYAANVRDFADCDPLDAERRVVLVLPRVEAAADYVEDDETRVRICFSMDEVTDVVARTLIGKLLLLDVGLGAYTLPALLLQAPASQRIRKPKVG